MFCNTHVMHELIFALVAKGHAPPTPAHKQFCSVHLCSKSWQIMVFLKKKIYLRFCRHITEPNGFARFSEVQCKIYLRFLLSLPQTAAFAAVKGFLTVIL